VEASTVDEATMAEGDFEKAMKALLAVPWNADKWRATRESEPTADRRRTRAAPAATTSAQRGSPGVRANKRRTPPA